MNQTKQAFVSDKEVLNANQATEILALFNADGTPYTGRDQKYAPITVSTAQSTAAKTTTSPEPGLYTIIPIVFENGNTADEITVSFDGGPARPVYYSGIVTLSPVSTLSDDGVMFVWFDGVVLHQISANFAGDG